MKVSSIQFEIRDSESKGQRLERMARMLNACQGSELIVLPEIWNTGYFSFDRYAEESETITGETMSLIAAKARGLNSYIMAGSFVENDSDHESGQDGRPTLYNTSVLLGPQGDVRATYRKIHLFGFGSEERKILTPGCQVVTVPTDIGVLGLATCYDLRFPEQFRKMLDQGVEILLISSAWPYPRLEAWRLFNQVRALENQCYLISANSAGTSQGKQFVGHSAIVDPWGVVIAAAGDEETVLTADIDIATVKKARDTFPAVSDRVEIE
ncbi:carbon-nitrogen family hydrolase [Paradesulfitobacterium aromaticivorans]